MTGGGIELIELEDNTTVVYLKGRYVGWVQPGRSPSGRHLGLWICNWRLENGSWGNPRVEDPSHTHRTREAAMNHLLEVLSR